MSKKDERQLLPDIIKGVAIIFVVLAHCIQEGSGKLYRDNSLYFDDRLYQFVCSFSMPLFMIVSGYLNWSSIQKAVGKKERRGLLKRRAISLLVPIFAWTAIDYIRILIINQINRAPQPEAFIFVYFHNALINLWFLWAVWWCFLVVYIMHYFLKDRIILYGIGFLVMFVIPDGLGLGNYKYMLPYFVGAYYIHGFWEHKKQETKVAVQFWMVIAIGAIFASMFAFFDKEFLIHISGYKLIGKNIARQLWIDFYRESIGLVGSIFFIVMWQYILDCTKRISQNKAFTPSFHWLAKIGSYSMGIYIVSGYLLIFGVQRVPFIDKQSYIVNGVETVIVVIGSILIVMLLEKIPIMKKLVGK